MKIPCAQKVDCQCDQLLTNYSSEDPDRFVFIAHNFGFAKVPPMNTDPGTDGCTTFGSSTASQEDADYCAERHQSGCEVNFAEPDPCQVCAPSVSQNQTSFGYSSTGTSTEIDPCCEPDAPIGCCCNDVPGNPDIPDTPPKTPDDPPDGPRLYGNAPQICELPCPDGTVYKYTVQAGYFVASSQILADRMAMSYACKQASKFRICISPFDGISCADPGLVNPDEVHQLTATSTLPVTSWAIVSGSLPTGIVLDTATGIMSGQPTVAGTYTFEVQATTSAGSTATRSMEWNILGFVTDADLPDATVSVAYSQQLLADGGAITFEITDGILPAGLTMDDAGLISGIPTTAVTDQEFTVSVSDNFGHTCDQQFLISVVQTCIPDTDCNLPQTTYSCVTPTNVTISDWNSKKAELIAPTADPAGVQPEWDGTLPIRDNTTFPGNQYWIPAGSVPPVWADYSFNGLFGDAIFIFSTNIQPFRLILRGTVGGVPTEIWRGEKTTGENPIGTFMRVSGLSAGPECFHVTGPSTPHALAWWAMQANPLAVVDSVCGLVLSSAAVGFVSIVAGHVGNALRIHSQGFQDHWSECVTANLVFPSEGITIALWVQSTYNISSPGSNNELIRYEFLVGGVTHRIDVEHFEGADWIADLDGAGLINKAFAAGWHFLAITYDPGTGTLGFDIDQSGMTTAPVAALSADASPLTLIRIANGTATSGVGNMDTEFDEMTIYNGVLTTAQLDCIYNAGVGRTW